MASLPGATVFHTWDWLRAIAPALGCEFYPLGLGIGSEIVGLAGLLVRRRGPFRIANWVPFPYLGPLVKRERLGEALDALDDFQRRQRIGLIQMGFSPEADVDPDILGSRGYAIWWDTTMILPLVGRTEEELWDGMHPSGRSKVRRAQRGGVVALPATEEEIVRVMPGIMRETYRFKGQPALYGDKAIERVWRRYADDPMGRLTSARHKGVAIATSITLGDSRNAYLWQSYGLRASRRLNPTALLYWDAICWAREKGFLYLDMVGTPDPGIAHYKASFGCIPRPYIVAYRENSRILGPLHRFARRTRPSEADRTHVREASYQVRMRRRLGAAFRDREP